MDALIGRAWRTRGPLACLLLPIGLAFFFAVALRRWLYRAGILERVKLPVPVVVVGNITAGGAGKTPLTIFLAAGLQRLGRCPGIVSRGYGRAEVGVRKVGAGATAAEVGDEPLLMFRRTGCPVFVGRDRVAAAQALLAAHPECDVILADDGLQHYRLARDVEIVVCDGRGAMNGWPLPAGPLREPLARLRTVDALVHNGPCALAAASVAVFRMDLDGSRFHRLGDPTETASAADLVGQRLHAFAGIGDPARFFSALQALGLACTSHAFPDHHRYASADFFLDGDAIVTTEKDAVKFPAGLPLPVWVLPVEARIAPDLAQFVVERIDGRPPA
ncbi:MAG: tetraacyldisaccharide 4'-kinase [Gammaproteobacteria bacterium]|nr:tetraacyldisaccharide 4'-kinase [Gammaproteobacteria bacterium]MBU1646323.1 tetraacyldisaccharide 4'-kinase [Gammaproteobacteria bacterium]MBU1970866.1 tetraacyldisaccharide 4'-kinase [Gammaproteobacteria bacterium]